MKNSSFRHTGIDHESSNDLGKLDSAPVFTGVTRRNDERGTEMGLFKDLDEMTDRARDIIDADAPPDKEAAPVRRAPVRRRVIPKK